MEMMCAAAGLGSNSRNTVAGTVGVARIVVVAGVMIVEMIGDTIVETIAEMTVDTVVANGATVLHATVRVPESVAARPRAVVLHLRVIARAHPGLSPGLALREGIRPGALFLQFDHDAFYQCYKCFLNFQKRPCVVICFDFCTFLFSLKKKKKNGRTHHSTPVKILHLVCR
eukprot:528322_1